jgi:glycosyltransferase involved in cell wall biosynthesis
MKKQGRAQDSSQPLVSFCIPAYNYERYVGYALQSAMAQTYPNLEIRVLNNGSTDATGQICDDLARTDPRVQVTHWPTVRPAVESHNALLQAAKGEFISIASADDLYYPDKITSQVALMQQQPHLAACFVLCDFIDGNNRSIRGYAPTFATPMSAKEITAGLLKSSVVCMPANLLRRSVLQTVGLFDPQVHQAFDLDYWLRIVTHQPLMAYRIHGKNAVDSHARVIAQDTWRIIARHGFNVLKNHPEIDVPPGYLEDVLAAQALGSGDWAASQHFITLKSAKTGLRERDVLRLVCCLLQQEKIQESKTLMQSIMFGRSVVLPQSPPESVMGVSPAA